jgi:hypothetical protein
MMITHIQQEQKIYHTLRIASAMCFIGHGAFGIITKPIWCNYFAVFGIGHDLAYKLMPIAGSFDVLLGIIMIIYPIRAVALWLVIWGVITASLRPLSGEPFAELIERAGNFGAPLALLILCGGGKNIRGWFSKIHADDIHIDEMKIVQLGRCLRIVAFLLLAGHGWLNIIHKKNLVGQYAALGFSNASGIADAIGLFEIITACAVLIKPLASFLLVLLAWKMASELFYPHYEIFEWVERGGSYGTLLALYFYMAGNKYNVNGYTINKKIFGFS